MLGSQQNLQIKDNLNMPLKKPLEKWTKAELLAYVKANLQAVNTDTNQFNDVKSNEIHKKRKDLTKKLNAKNQEFLKLKEGSEKTKCQQELENLINEYNKL
jgi:hypothetical protein